MANPKQLSWTHSGQYTDGSTFGAADFAGWVLEVNGQPNLSVPAGWNTNNVYAVQLSEIDVFKQTGNFDVRMALVAKNGNQSDWSNHATFTMDFRKPAAITGLSVG